jgi:hypothetical protein
MAPDIWGLVARYIIAFERRRLRRQRRNPEGAGKPPADLQALVGRGHPRAGSCNRQRARMINFNLLNKANIKPGARCCFV